MLHPSIYWASPSLCIYSSVKNSKNSIFHVECDFFQVIGPMPKSQSKELRMTTWPLTVPVNMARSEIEKNSTYGSRNGLFLKFSHSELRVYGSYSLSSSVLLSVSQPLIMSPKACLLGVHASKIDIFGSKFFSVVLYPYFSHNNSKTKDRTRKSLWSEVGARLGFHMRHMRLVLSQFPVRQIEFRVPPPLFALTP